jgi:hypothetical protein
MLTQSEQSADAWVTPPNGPAPASVAPAVGAGYTLTFTRDNGGAFDLHGFLLSFSGGSTPAAGSLSALTLGGATVSHDLVLVDDESLGDWTPYEPPAIFTDIVSLTVANTGTTGRFLAVDDIRVSVVPVPAAVWLFVSALGALGWRARRG